MNIYTKTIARNFIIFASALFHHQYAMEAEKTSSKSIKSLTDLALPVFLDHADFDNIVIRDLFNIEHLNYFSQAREIAEYLEKKYKKPAVFSIKDITFSLDDLFCPIVDISCDGKNLFYTDMYTVNQYKLNKKNNHFDFQGTMDFKDRLFLNGKINQFSQNNYVLWNKYTILENNKKLINLYLSSLKEQVVGVAKNNNKIFLATTNRFCVLILPEKFNLIPSEEWWKIDSKKCEPMHFHFDEIIDGIGFKQSIDPNAAIFEKNGKSVILQNDATGEKFMWDREKGTYTSLANFIKNSDSVLDVYGNNNILIKSFNANDNTFTLNLWRKTKNKHYVIFSRNYPCDIADLKARLIEQNNQIIGIVTCITKNQSSDITVSLFNTELCKLNPTEILFLAQLLKNPIIIATPEPAWHNYDNLD